MPNTDLEIKTIQFKRGKKEILEEKLVVDKLGVPADGEPIYETDTGKLKIGDGETAYIDLAYVGGSGSDIDIPKFIIQDPLSNQILLYDETRQAWVNKDLADTESIIYLAERGLTIKGYESAAQGQMLVKDTTVGLTWVDPPSIADINAMNAIAARAETAETGALNARTEALTAATNADKSAQTADRINQQTMNWVNNKFWWGTAAEYKAEITENGLNPEAFYFIKIS
jgi:hypothetical protein